MGRKEDEEDARRAREQARARRDEEIQRRLDEEAEREEIERMTDADMDLETMQIIADLGISVQDFDKILNTRYDDPEIQASVDNVKEAQKRWTRSGREKATRKAVKKNKQNLKKANKERKSKGGCLTVLVLIVGGVTTALTGIVYAGYEVVSHFV